MPKRERSEVALIGRDRWRYESGINGKEERGKWV